MLALETVSQILVKEPQLLADLKSIGILRAVSHSSLSIFKSKKLYCQQTFKGDFDRLKQHGYEAVTELPRELDLCLVIAGKQKDENLVQYAKGLESLRQGGKLLVVLENDLGAARFEKELKKLGLEVFSWHKNCCRVFGVIRAANIKQEVFELWRSLAKPQVVRGAKLLSQPGVFAWSKVDRGSEILVKYLANDLSGSGADLGAGYGFLSYHILAANPKIEKLHVVEAEKLALDMAALNLKATATGEIVYHWLDVTQGLEFENLDWVVTNPPFHAGKAVRMSLGSRFIIEAANCLRKNGRLYMVANKHLPYEAILKKYFSSFETLAVTQGFKVLSAIK